MKPLKTKSFLKFCLATLVLCSTLENAKAANIVFSFSTTTTAANGEAMDLFTTGGLSGLVTNASNPSVYFALGYVNSTFDFAGKDRTSLLSAITYIGSSNSNWSAVGSYQATGGKVNVSFANGGNGFDTAALGWAGKKLVAVVSQGVNPVGGTITDSTNLAIVRGGSVWDSILAPDAAPSPTTQALDTRSFTVLYGTYASNAGYITSADASRPFDTVTLVPEPSTSTLLILSGLSLAALRRLRKV
jgi:hypothetical protein